MNAYKLNGIVGSVTRFIISQSLGIQHEDIYKEVKNISINGVVETKDGKKYQLEIKEVI